MSVHNANRYRAGCRCTDCYRAMRLDTNLRRLEALQGNPRHVDGTGTRRRLQALAANGWSMREIADRLGVTNASINARLRKAGPVHRGTAAKVRALYDELWDVTPPPMTGKAKGVRNRIRRDAAKRGWHVPMAWDTIDDPAATPFVDEPIDITRPGQGRVNADSLHDCAIEWGMTIEQAAVRLSVSRDAIYQGLIRLPGDDEQRSALRAAFHRNATAQGHDRPTRDGLGLRRRTV